MSHEHHPPAGDKAVRLNAPALSPGVISFAVVGRFLAIFLPTALVLGGMAWVLYALDLSNERALYEQAGAHLVDLHADIITRELKSVKSDLFYLANQAVLQDYLSGGVRSKRVLQDEYLLFSRQKGLYDQIRFLGASGREAIRINYNNGNPGVVAEHELQPKGGRYYFRQTMLLDRGEVFISPFDLNVELEEIERPLKPMIRFGTPVFDKCGTKRGVLILNYLGAALIGKLAAVSVNFPGSAMLLNQDGFFLHGPKAEDEWGFMFGYHRTFATYYPEAWKVLSRDAFGQVQTGLGLFTFRAVSPRAEIGGTRQVTKDSPARDYSDPDAGDAGLRVVSYIPPDVLAGRSTELLKRILLFYGAAMVLVFVLAGYLAYASALRRSHERQIAESEARLRTLSKQLITAQEDERRSLSRDLHDELGQLVTAVTLVLQQAGQAAGPDKKNDLIARGLQGTERLLDCIHEIAARVRPMILDDLGLKDAVQSLLSHYEEQTGVVPRADLQFEHHHVPAVVSENVYRILQEALTNVSRHAQTQEVFVKLQVTAQHVRLTVRDDGVGFVQAELGGKGLGMLGMRERAELLDGSFVVKSEPGQGTQIDAAIPIEPNQTRGQVLES